MGHRGRRWVWLLITSVAVLAVASVGLILVRSNASSHSPAFDLRTVGTACANDRAWVCGSIRVPVDRSSRNAGSFTVRFRVLPRRLTAKTSSGTIVVVAGGPGEAAMNQYMWARSAFRSLLSDHDLLLVDNRGSGASDPIDCPKAEQGFSSAAAAQCRTLLGARANDYGTVAAVDDLEAVLNRIHANDVDLYSESYGTFFAQVFALRYPDRLQRLVLDGALPLHPDLWTVDSIPAALAALRTLCPADPACDGSEDPGILLGKALTRLRAGPPGRLRTLGPTRLAVLLEGAGRKGSAYRELLAALRSYLSGDLPPLIRLMNEAQGGAAGTDPPHATPNGGLGLADTCGDYPLPFDLRAPLAVQRRQLSTANARVAASSARALLPFTPKEALVSRSIDFCLGWPAPKNPPPRSRHQRFPKVPTLVLEGALDTVTPPAVARSVAREFPDARYIEVPFVRHIAAVRDESGCAASIAAAFIASETINTACLSRIARPPQVDAFPETFAEETPVTPSANDGTSSLPEDDRRTVALTRDAISDVLRLWGPLQIYSGIGLRGGRFTTIPPITPGDFSVRLNAVHWTRDSTVTGVLTTSPTAHTLSGSVVVSTPTGQANLHIRSPQTLGPSTQETISGRLGGHSISVTIDAKLGL